MLKLNDVEEIDHKERRGHLRHQIFKVGQYAGAIVAGWIFVASAGTFIHEITEARHDKTEMKADAKLIHNSHATKQEIQELDNGPLQDNMNFDKEDEKWEVAGGGGFGILAAFLIYSIRQGLPAEASPEEPSERTAVS